MHPRPAIPTVCASLVFLLLAKTCFSTEKPVVHFGIGLRYHPINIYENFQPMMDYLSRNTPYRFELKISRDYKETFTSLIEGKTAISSVGDGGVMKAMLHGAVPIVKPLNADGEPVYRSCIVVPTNSSIRSLSDLKGKHLAFGSRHSTTGHLIPRKMLSDSGITIKHLGSIHNLRNHDAVARAIVKGEYNAGAVKSTVAERYMKHGLRIIACSEDLPSIPLIMRKDSPKELVAAITGALLKLNRNNPEHRTIMRNWDPEYKNGFAPVTQADYAQLLTMFKTKPYGCSKECHR